MPIISIWSSIIFYSFKNSSILIGMAHRKPSFILPAHFCSQNGVGCRRRVLHIMSLGALRLHLHWVINVAQKGPETQPSVPGLDCSTARQHGSWLLYTWPEARENQLCQQMLLPMNWWNHKKCLSNAYKYQESGAPSVWQGVCWELHTQGSSFIHLVTM